MQAELLTGPGAGEKLGAADARRDHVLAVAVRSVEPRDLLALVVQEDQVIRTSRDALCDAQRVQRLEGGSNPRGERPDAGLFCLVDVDRDGAASQIQVAPPEPRGFAAS
jgi:hypothetical protein